MREVALAWRRLTSPRRARRGGPGAPTLVACSGGADSSALVLALAAVTDQFVVAHVVHDLRPIADAEADRDVARELAQALGLPFEERRVTVRSRAGNAEAVARAERYAALHDMARQRGLRYIATAHHSHDQAESVLMHLLRGSGPRGLSGIAARRRAASGSPVQLIRPMLTVAPEACRDLCRQCGWTWREDATNSDTTRLRAAIRHTVLPQLLAIRSDAAQRLAAAADLQHEVANLIHRTAKARRAGRSEWPRASLRKLSPPVLGEFLRQAAIDAGARADRLSARTLAAACRLIRSDDTDPHRLDWTGVHVHVDAHHVGVTKAVR